LHRRGHRPVQLYTGSQATCCQGVDLAFNQSRFKAMFSLKAATKDSIVVFNPLELIVHVL